MVALHRWLPEHHAPLSAPVSPRHSHKHNFYIGIVLVVFMAVSVVALVCCCYNLEWRLRLQARNAARRMARSNSLMLQDATPQDMGVQQGKKIKQETSLSVMMPGDSIPSFLARAKPHVSPIGSDFCSSLGTGPKDTS